MFSLEKTFECGQCFRFEKDGNGNGNGYSGVAFGRKLHALAEGGCVVLENVSKEEYKSVWESYFDLGRDYGLINAALSRDKTVSSALEAASGIRILRQDPWETLCSFIISQNNNIPRIKKIIELLCKNFGQDIGGAYAFPSAKAIAEAGKNKLSVINCGYRAEYIADAAQKVADGQINLNAVGKMECADAKNRLMEIKGVGPKVADCVLLFGFSRLSAFPRDVWIKRVIDKYYGEGFDESIFAPYGGIAQQYLFYYERNISK